MSSVFLLSSKHLVILIDPRLVLHRVLLSHREIIHLIHVQYSFQVGVAYKIHAEKIIGFSFHVIGRSVQCCCAEYIGLFYIGKYF